MALLLCIRSSYYLYTNCLLVFNIFSVNKCLLQKCLCSLKFFNHISMQILVCGNKHSLQKLFCTQTFQHTLICRWIPLAVDNVSANKCKYSYIFFPKKVFASKTHFWTPTFQHEIFLQIVTTVEMFPQAANNHSLQKLFSAQKTFFCAKTF